MSVVAATAQHGPAPPPVRALPGTTPAGQSPPTRAADERRVVTILFCDVVGSTAMAEALDPEEWAEIMHEAFGQLIEPVERYGGTLARLMGDAILAFFGAPQAHEDDPQRAILAGLAIVEAIQPLRERVRRLHGLDFDVRVGINTGLVVVGDFGARDRFEYTAMGDAINLAARVEQTAAPGTVVVAGATHRLTAPLFEFEALGEIAVRGRAGREPVYRALRVRPATARPWDIAGLGSPLVGREGEMAVLRQAYEELRQGRGQIVLIVAEPGLGKSRLIDELRRHWEEDARRAEAAAEPAPVAWLENRLVSYEAPQPYGAVQQRLRRVFGIERRDAPAVVREKVARATQQFPAELRERATRLIERIFSVEGDTGRSSLDAAGAAGKGGTAAGGPEGIDGADGTPSREFRREMTEVMAALLRGWNRGGPLVFVGDDYHWFDAASAALVGELLQLAEEAPILFLCAFRPDPNSPVWPLREAARTRHAGRCTEIRLQPLSPADSARLLDALVEWGEQLSGLRERILQQAEGNPLFVEELVRSLIDQGVLEPMEGTGPARWRPVAGADPASVSIPSSIQALLLERIDRLGPGPRRTLQLAAVIGRTFGHPVLEAIAGREGDLEQDLAALQRLDLIRESAREPEREYAFRHPLIQEVAYGTLLLRHRQECHRRVGEAIETLYAGRLDEQATSLGRHYSRAGDARAIDWLVRAAERAQAIQEPRTVIEAVSQARRLAQRLDRALPPRAFELLGQAHETVGDYASAREDYQRALELAQAAGDARGEWQALLSLGLAWAERDYARAGDYYREALERAEGLPDGSPRAHSLNRLGNWYSNVGRPLDAFAAHREALGIFERLGGSEGLAETRDLLGMAGYLAGDLVASADSYARAVELFRELGDRRGLASSLAMLTLASGSALSTTVLPAVDAVDAGEAAGAAGAADVGKPAEEALAIAGAIGWQAGEAFALMCLAQATGLQGEYGRALAAAERARLLAEEIGHRQWTVGADVTLGALLLDLLELDEARRHLECALGAAREIGSHFWTGTASALLAATEIARGQFDRARRVLDAALDAAAPADSLGRRECWQQRAALELAVGNAEEALAIVDMLARAAPCGRDAGVSPHLRLVRARALGRLGRQGEAADELAEADRDAARLGYRPLRWRIARAAAALACARGDHAAAGEASAVAGSLIDELLREIPDADLRGRVERRAHEDVAAICGGTRAPEGRP